MKLTIPFLLPGLNDYIAAERSHRQKEATMKRQYQDAVIMVIRRQIRGKLREPVRMRYLWVEKNRRYYAAHAEKERHRARERWRTWSGRDAC